MFEVQIYTRNALVVRQERITSGSAGIDIRFQFDNAWAEVSRVAGFRGSGEAIDVVLMEDRCKIPPEVMTVAGSLVQVGVYGCNDEGDVILPTVWADLGRVLPGAVQSGISSSVLTPTIGQQLLALIRTGDGSITGYRGGRNDPVSVAELLGVAKSYYDVRGTAAQPLFKYEQANTAIDPGYYDEAGNPRPADGDRHDPRNIDCSTFVGLCLRGVPFRLSPYAALNASDAGEAAADDEDADDPDIDDGESTEYRYNWPEANTNGYGWAVNPAAYLFPAAKGGATVPVRNAAQLGLWMESMGQAIPLLPGFTNLMPGDVIFWAKHNADGSFRQKIRYRHISHVAICYSVMDAPAADLTMGQTVNVTVESFDPVTAQQTLEQEYGDENNVFRCRYRWADGRWDVRKRLKKVDGIWTWSTATAMTAAALGIIVEQPQPDPDPEAESEAGFDLTLYHWDRETYPLKHTMLEVTTISPYVLNRTLEKIRPEEVCLICRPDLGAVQRSSWVGNITTLMGLTSVASFYRPGDYYLTSAVTGGLPDGVTNGLGWSLRIWNTMRPHGEVYSITQEFYRTNGTGPVYRHSKYCYSKAPEDPTNNWTPFQAFVPMPAGGLAGQALVKASDDDYDVMWG